VFLHYLKAFDSKIASILQTMGGHILPLVYDFAIRAENILIQSGKLAPRPSMSLFPNMPTHQPMVSHIPIITMS